MKTLLKSQDLWDMVEQGYGEPKEAPQENRKKDAKALLFIQSAVDDEIFLRIFAASTSKQAWDIIQKEYFGDKKANAQQKHQEYDAAAGMEEELYITATGMEEEVYGAATSGSIEGMRGVSNWKDQQTPTYNNVLHLHVGKSRFEMVRYLKWRYTRVDSEFINYVLDDVEGYWLLWKQNSNGDTPLHLAARFGHSNAVEAFLKRAKKVYQPADEVTRILSITNTSKDTALHEAARAGHPEVVQLLVQADPHFSSYTQPNDNEMVKSILEKDRSLMRIQDEEGLTPLHSAAIETLKINHLEILLKEDKHERESSAAYLQDNMGRTPLHLAMLRRNEKALDALIKSRPDCIEIVDHKGQNVLHSAATWGFQGVIDWVVKQALYLDKHINNKNSNGDTPLHILAAYVEENPDVPFVIHRLKPFLINFPSFDKKAFNKQNRTVGDILPSIVRIWSHSEVKELIKLPRGRRENSYEREIKIDIEKAVSYGIEWDIESLKKTAETRLVVATLIATISFAAAVTVPGGSDQNPGKDMGMPVLKGNTWYKMFIVSDGIAFVTSSLAILFYFNLVSPSKTVTRTRSSYGLFLNTVALGALMMAFIAAMGVVSSNWICILIILFTLFFFYYFFWYLVPGLVNQYRYLNRRFGVRLDRALK